MDKAELDKIMGLYKSHLQVKKLLAPDTISLYLSSIKSFVSFCEKFHQKLAIPDKWLIENLRVREIEVFMQHQMNVLNWKRSTMVTCICGIKIFYQFLTEFKNVKNPIQHFKLPRDINEIGQRSIEINEINQLFEYSFEDSFKTDTTIQLKCRNPCHQTPRQHGPPECYSNLPRWSWEMDQRSCVAFRFGGCGGNDNRFKSEKECIDACNWTTL